MKKIVLFIVFFIGFYPAFRNSGVSIQLISSAQAQEYGFELDDDGKTSLYGGNLPGSEGTDDQDGRLCLPKSLEYAFEYYGIENMGQRQILFDYVGESSGPNYDAVFEGGIPYGNSQSTINQYFDNTKLQYTDPNTGVPHADPYGIIGAIEQGHPVVAIFRTIRDTPDGPEPGPLHTVFVTGIDPESGEARMLNPGNGQYETIDSNRFIDIYEISGPRSEYLP